MKRKKERDGKLRVMAIKGRIEAKLKTKGRRSSSISNKLAKG
jgi:hypothetical protein